MGTENREYPWPSDEGPRHHTVLINLVSANTALKRRMDLFERTSRGVGFLFSENPLQKKAIGIYLIPTTLLPLLNDPRRLDYKPVLLFGPAHVIYSAFRAGCADYLKEPWDEQELLARTENLVHSIFLDYSWGLITLRDAECLGIDGSVMLSPAESIILHALAQKRGQIVPRHVLGHLLWGAYTPESRALDMHISALRKKMRAVLPNTVRTIILTCRPGGYMLR